ncbi:MAG TPA: NIPSNAP family protein [Thermoanaerobaculia bacterium]|nr:NIPSNAP family protein [Thermoanaerobaculia bacterium]
MNVNKTSLCVLFAWAVVSGTATAAEGVQMPDSSGIIAVHGTEHDFDFLAGSWSVRSRRLVRPLSGSREWIEFEGTNVSRPVWNGAANVDEFQANAPAGPLEGMTIRLFDPQSRQWRIYWANGAKAAIDVSPMTGGFEKGHGEFYGHEVFHEKPIVVRFLWTVHSPDAARWEQAFSADEGQTWETNWTWDLIRMKDPQHAVPQPERARDVPNVYKVLELRRYTLKPGRRSGFAEYFDTFFPEAMQQLGAIAAGGFLNRENPLMFTWIRAYHDMDERARFNAEFYYGPVWKEHKSAANSMMDDSDNVLLLRPVSDAHALLVLPAVNPLAEPHGATGVVLSLLFPVKPERMDAFVADAEKALARYPAEIREIGMFVTLNERNNFPQHPVRSDGPFVCWFGVAKDDAALERASGVTKEVLESLTATGALREAPEVMTLDPSRRSRLRWLPE